MLLLNLQFALSKSRKKVEKIFKGAHGFEPWTYRTAADCSTTELYPLLLSPDRYHLGRPC